MTTAVFGILLAATPCHSLNPIAHAESNNAEWHITVTGIVQQPLNITLTDLLAMPQTTVYASLICVGSPAFLVTEGNWTGVKLWLILQEAQVLNGTVEVVFLASDGYTTDLTLEAAERNDVLIAYEKDGVPLNETLRLVVPGEMGYKWISQIIRIELVNYDFLSTYQRNGYADNPTATSKNGFGTAAPNPPDHSNSSDSTQFPIPNPSTPSQHPELPTETELNKVLLTQLLYFLTAIAIIVIVAAFLQRRIIKTKLRNPSLL